MQTFFMFSPNISSQRGARVSDPSIEDSGLGALIRQTFADLSLPDGIGGCVKFKQRHDNPDLFDIYFFSNNDSENYRADRIYTARDIARFDRTDFDDFPATEQDVQRRLQEFARRLIAGELKASS